MLNLFCASNIQGRELCWRDFMKYTFGTLTCLDLLPICFKLGMMLNTTNLGFDSSLNCVDVHSRSQGYGKGRICAVILLYSCVKQLKSL